MPPDAINDNKWETALHVKEKIFHYYFAPESSERLPLIQPSPNLNHDNNTNSNARAGR